ncbi:MAG: transposase [Gammaproteobacteria bacterium]
MPNYRRARTAGGTFFFTVVTQYRRPWLCTPLARAALRRSIHTVRVRYPFRIDAWVLLPDHMHCIWTLPKDDSDYAGRWRLIKMLTAKRLTAMPATRAAMRSRAARRERALWQRRFWEHRIRDARDMAAHMDYIHYNPVKHELCPAPADWAYSSFHRYVRNGTYERDWAADVEPPLPDHVGKE